MAVSEAISDMYKKRTEFLVIFGAPNDKPLDTTSSYGEVSEQQRIEQNRDFHKTYYDKI